VLASLKQLAVASLSHLQTRLSLLEIELQEEKSRLATIAVSMVLAFLFIMLGLVIGSFGVVAYFWDTEFRMQAVWGLTGAFLVGAIICGTVFRSKLKARSSLFQTSLAELRKDQAVLEDEHTAAELEHTHEQRA
jgi:uncharacterized membrane protein YqjE